MGLDEMPIGKRGRCFIYRMVALTRNPNLTMTANTNRTIPKTLPGTCDVMDTE